MVSKISACPENAIQKFLDFNMTRPVLIAQLCLTLCNSCGLCIPPGSSVHGTVQVSILPFPSPGILPDPGVEPVSPASQADS